MTATVDAQRCDRAISVLGGPPAVVDTAEVLGARLVIPAHVDGWAHFSQGVDEFVAAFDEAGIGNVLRVAAHGEWIDLTDPAGS